MINGVANLPLFSIYMSKQLIFTFALIVFYCNTVFSANYLISGEIKGNEDLNYAYAFNNSSQELLSVVKIVDHKFAFDGEIWQRDKFGYLQAITVFLSKDSLGVEQIKDKRLLSGRKHYNCTVILAERISLSYDSKNKLFLIDGGKSNEVQNLFENDLGQYRNSRDSLYNIIDAKPISAENKTAEKIKIQLNLFTTAMHGFLKIVKNHPDEVSLLNFITIIIDQGIPTNEIEAAFALFPETLKKSRPGLQLYKDLQYRIRNENLLKKPAYTTGMKFPDFVLPGQKGEKIVKQDVLGKYTLIDFWATWCGPCRKETPNVIKAFDKFGSKGFKVVTISIDDTEDQKKWLAALSSDKMDQFINLFNGSDISGLARELKVVAIPMNYLLDENGIIVATNLRGEQLTKKLEELTLR